MNAQRRSVLLMIVFVALWAAVESAAASMVGHLSPFQVVWSRYGVHLAIMVLMWGWHVPASLVHTRRQGFQWARSMLMVGMPACWILAQRMGLDSRTLMDVFWLAPLMVLLLARWFLREYAAAPLWWTTLAAVAGVWLVMGPGPLAVSGGLLFALGMALCFSLYVVMTRSLRTEATRANLFYTALGPFVVLTPAMPFVWQAPAPRDLAVLAFVGCAGFLGLFALDRMAAAAPVSTSAAVTCLEVVFALIFAAALGQASADVRTLGGTLLIVCASAYVWLRASALQVEGGEPPPMAGR